ncbi:MAG TPA: ferredoxin [Clostridiales bacterium]|nr:MAG: ferredoxin [Clostridiales bacterium GWD2_32_59]HAN09746.1 ferredoxin [Clostridiales bacterium]
MRGKVDKDLCISCGLCPDVCPEIFRFDDDEKAIAEDIEIPEDVVDRAKEAEDGCPTSAIIVK